MMLREVLPSPPLSYATAGATLPRLPLLLVLFLPWPFAAAAAATVEDRALLDGVNRRWAGASCRLRFEVPIKKGRDGEGWSKSSWIVPGQDRKVRKGNTGAILRVSSRDLLPGGAVGPETAFVAQGWDVEDGLRLRLSFANARGQAAMTFHATFGKDLGIGDLSEIEQWARLDLFHVSAADERLEDAGPPPAPPAPAEPLPAPAVVELLMFGTAVDPMTVFSGSEIRLIATYEVRGPALGEGVDVRERREIVRQGVVLASLEAVARRSAGTHRSVQTLTIPSDVPPGILELRVTILGPGTEASGRALFEVSQP